MRIIASILLLCSTTAALADTTIEIYDSRNKSWFNGGGITAGVEMSRFPSPLFFIGVEFKGVASPTGKWHYFMVSGAASFDQGQNYKHEEWVPDAPFLDINIVPVTDVIGMLRSKHAHDATALRFMQLEIQRDVKLDVEASVAVHAIGLVRDKETPIWESNPNVRAFIRTAVDLVGFRYLREGIARSAGDPHNMTPDHDFAGIELGSVKAEGGAVWDLTRATSLRLTLAAESNFATFPGGVAGTKFFAEADLFASFELMFKTAFQRWSLFVKGGGRGLLNDPQLDDGLKGYGYLQIGLKGTFR